MANFEAFCRAISSSINLLFLKSAYDKKNHEKNSYFFCSKWLVPKGFQILIINLEKVEVFSTCHHQTNVNYDLQAQTNFFEYWWAFLLDFGLIFDFPWIFAEFLVMDSVKTELKIETNFQISTAILKISSKMATANLKKVKKKRVLIGVWLNSQTFPNQFGFSV